MADYSIENDNKFEIIGLNDIKADLNLGLKQPFKAETASVLELKPLEVKPLELKPLKADLGTDSKLKIEPLKLELEAHPLKTESSLSLDLKPAVVDLCLTANIGKLPNVCIRQPYQHHIGFTLFGAEIWGFTVSGQQETIIDELDRQPRVAWRGAQVSRPAQLPIQKPAPEPPSRSGGGLRVRLDP